MMEICLEMLEFGCGSGLVLAAHLIIFDEAHDQSLVYT
jgi:hypothetical protein